ncbi:MAG: phosphatase PAP2 family protein, partial [Planctomycetaceae bacterium]|nr:phosphatase PAP2 family protein [Planctomycetaceae bacterium]
MPPSISNPADDNKLMVRWVVIPATFLVLALIALFTLDLPIARACAPRNWPDEIHRYLRTVESFGTIYGQGMLLLGMYCVLVPLRRRIPRILAASIAAGMTANVIKLMIGRQRPKYFDVTSASAMDSFEQWFPFLHDGASLKSFPSAHTASAVAFAVLMSHLFPRGRWLFGTCAALVAVQRIEVCEHFLSDVLVAGAVGWLVGQSFVRVPQLAAWFDRFESADGGSSRGTDGFGV